MVKVPQSLYLIHFMLMLAPALFALVIFFVALPQEPQAGTTKEETAIFQTVAALLTVIAVGMSQLVPRFLMREEKNVPMRRYINMKIVQWALLEGSAIFMGIVFYLTHHKNMLIPLGVLIGIIAMMRPTVDELQRFKIRE